MASGTDQRHLLARERRLAKWVEWATEAGEEGIVHEEIVWRSRDPMGSLPIESSRVFRYPTRRRSVDDCGLGVRAEWTGGGFEVDVPTHNCPNLQIGTVPCR